MKAVLPIIALCAWTGEAMAEAPGRAPHPVPRPVGAATAAVMETTPGTSPRPVPRPADQVLAMARNAGASAVPRDARGSVCGVRAIRGQVVAPVKGRVNGCGIAEPVKVTAVSGVTLSQAVLVDCSTAKALNSWVERGVAPAVGRTGGGLAGLKIIAHYSCRTRNSRPGAKISEHGKGHAIDVAGVILKNGKIVTVLDNWSGRYKKIIRAMHKSACGPFGTVLGPNADRYHRDHIHVDTARYRSGRYCR